MSRVLTNAQLHQTALFNVRPRFRLRVRHILAAALVGFAVGVMING